MSISLLLLVLFLLFLIPSYLLPRNRLKVYLYSAVFSFLVIGCIGVLDRIGRTQLEDRRGRFFSPFFSFRIKPIIGITEKERHHVYCYLANALIYVVSFVLSAPVFSLSTGENPSVHRNVRWLSRFFLSSAFVVFTYGIFALFIINLRRIIPLPSGIREPFFNLFYSIGA